LEVANLATKDEAARLRDWYFATLGIKQDSLENSDPSPQKTALDRAYQQRTFEIEHYWKRATYFWGFQVAIFAAFGFIWKESNANHGSIMQLALAALGVLTALANWLSARGSKFEIAGPSAFRQGHYIGQVMARNPVPSD
jgi:hypothetical protein